MLACLPACLPDCLLACLPACLPACLLALLRSLEALAAKATGLLQRLALDDEVHERLGTSPEALDAQGWAPTDWVELVCLLEYQDPVRAQSALPACRKLHLELSSKATAHLALVISNITRTTWTAAGVLSSDPDKARTSAQCLLRQLDSIAPDSRTPFERHMAEAYYSHLEEFGKREPPVRVWQGQGAFKPLFQFLALRFLTAPDQVLDCERLHARWQWICKTKRSIKMPLMNGWLRTSQFMEANGFSLPPEHVLQPHLEYATALDRAAQLAVAARGDVAPGMRKHVRSVADNGAARISLSHTHTFVQIPTMAAGQRGGGQVARGRQASKQAGR